MKHFHRHLKNLNSIIFVHLAAALAVSKIIVKNLLCQFLQPWEVVTPKLWVPLNPAHQDASFGTLESQIKLTVIEILWSKLRNLQKRVK